MRLIALAALLLAPVAAAAPKLPLPTAEVSHAIAYLRGGGTYAEAQALADQIAQSAQADMAKQQSAAAKVAPAKPTKEAAP